MAPDAEIETIRIPLRTRFFNVAIEVNIEGGLRKKTQSILLAKLDKMDFKQELSKFLQKFFHQEPLFTKHHLTFTVKE